MKELLSECPIPAGKGIEDLPPSEMEIQLRSFVSRQRTRVLEPLTMAILTLSLPHFTFYC
jgi:hypothetical protein